LANSPELVNSAPYDSWFFKLEPSDTSELDNLLDPVAYKAAIGE
jgi:glycine cleavage system H protein